MRCKGTTKEGKKCKITRNLSVDGYCKYHQYQLKAKGKKSGKNEYQKYMASPEWKLKRSIVLSVLGKTCKLCGGYGSTVHHNTYARLYNEDLLKDLTVLCKGCHSRFHRKGKR